MHGNGSAPLKIISSFFTFFDTNPRVFKRILNVEGCVLDLYKLHSDKDLWVWIMEDFMGRMLDFFEGPKMLGRTLIAGGFAYFGGTDTFFYHQIAGPQSFGQNGYNEERADANCYGILYQ
jgi:hypothetical protein